MNVIDPTTITRKKYTVTLKLLVRVVPDSSIQAILDPGMAGLDPADFEISSICLKPGWLSVVLKYKTEALSPEAARVEACQVVEANLIAYCPPEDDEEEDYDALPPRRYHLIVIAVS